MCFRFNTALTYETTFASLGSCQPAFCYDLNMAAARRKSEVDPDNRLSGLWATLIVGVFFYVLPLIAVAIDELALGTYWLVRNFPEGSRSVFFDVYPFLRFLE
jgi:hypothetical protein